jgi:hypothetical protein
MSTVHPLYSLILMTLKASFSTETLQLQAV